MWLHQALKSYLKQFLVGIVVRKAKKVLSQSKLLEEAGDTAAEEDSTYLLAEAAGEGENSDEG